MVPLFARSFEANTVEIGMINSSFLLMAGLLSLPLGILSDLNSSSFVAYFTAMNCNESDLPDIGPPARAFARDSPPPPAPVE